MKKDDHDNLSSRIGMALLIAFLLWFGIPTAVGAVRDASSNEKTAVKVSDSREEEGAYTENASSGDASPEDASAGTASSGEAVLPASAGSASASDTSEKKACDLEVEAILQNPELPTGCEVTSLTENLVYLGFDIDKMTLEKDYLVKKAAGTAFPDEVFLGNPESRSGLGCYAPVIVRCANDYLEDQNADMLAVNLTGHSLYDLFKEIQQGYPVIIWVTNGLAEPHPSTTWKIHGRSFTWITPMHCMLLTGYNLSANIVYAADPLKGNVSYDLNLFQKRFNQMGKQAVVIRENAEAEEDTSADSRIR